MALICTSALNNSYVADYAMHHGGRCRDCADHMGVCPNSGMSCDPVERRQAIEMVLKAVDYGFSKGFIPPKSDTTE